MPQDWLQSTQYGAICLGLCGSFSLAFSYKVSFRSVALQQIAGLIIVNRAAEILTRRFARYWTLS
jgi:hypothetical protein